MAPRIRISDELTLVNTNYPHGTGGERIQFIAGHGRITVTIDGPKTEVNALVYPVAAADGSWRAAHDAIVEERYASEVQRALIALGFSETERSVGVDRNRVPQALKTFSSWIDRLQSLPVADEELCATWSEYMRARFGGGEPPMTPTAVNEAAHAAHYAITMQLQLFPPRSRTVSTAGNSYAEEWTELSAWREAGLACQIGSPKELAETARMNFGQFVDRKVTREWQDETGEQSPKLAGQRIASLVNDVHGQSQRIQALLDERELWREKTNCEHPKEFASEWSEVEYWKTETGCLTATGASELIKALRKEDNSLQIAKSQLVHWESCTGCATPHEAQETINALRAKLRERDQDLLTANAEIDRVKKAAQTLGLVSEISTELTKVQDENLALRSHLLGKVFSAHPDCVRLTSELAKVRAELQTKQHECQTEKERADRVEKKAYEQNERAGRAQEASDARGVLLQKIGEALQLGTSVLWDPLPGQVAYVVEQRQFEKMRADAAEKRYADRVFSSEDLAQETNEIVEIITAQLKDAGIVSAAQSIACRTASLSKAHTLTMKARKVLGAKAGENISDAAKRVMSTAIIPLPKPESIEPGQKWAKLITTRDLGNVLGSPPEHYVGSVLGILYKERLLGNLDGWLFLG